ncbi:MAG: hypothetical protein BMS9Abin33_0980 [Gammaproteobacteria bacterium]|nr:MAG: hypothetical protein BMS9Abin33_0980 [Gammaproteobacteria bacterium]
MQSLLLLRGPDGVNLIGQRRSGRTIKPPILKFILYILSYPVDL